MEPISDTSSTQSKLALNSIEIEQNLAENPMLSSVSSSIEESGNKPISTEYLITSNKESDFEIKFLFYLGTVEHELLSLRFDPADQYLSASYKNGTISVYNLMNQKEAFKFNTDLVIESPTTSLRWRPSNSLSSTKNVMISVNTNGIIQHWHTTSGSLINSIKEENNEIYCTDFNFDGQKFVSAGQDSIVRLYDENTKKIILNMKGSYKIPGHSSRIFSAKFSKEEENMLYTGGWDNIVIKWDIRNGEIVKIYPGPFICGDSIDVHDNFMITGSYRPENKLQVWNINDTNPINDVLWKNEHMAPSIDISKVYSVQMHKEKGDFLLVGYAGSNEARMYFTNFGIDKEWTLVGRISNLSRAVYSVDFANQKNIFAIGGGDGIIRVFSLEKKV